MYLHRKIDDYFIKWKKDNNHKPLIVKGARQIGKTESIMHFANKNYKNVVYINFALEKKFHSILDQGYDYSTVVKNISFVDPSKNFIPNNTIIIFDEIQDLPDIATTLKSFNQAKQYDVICSGSLLGINYKKIHSNSVGNKIDYEMHSMDFEEFLWANGYAKHQIDIILNHMINNTPFSKPEFETFKNLFLSFCVLGGMPEIVKTYISTNSYSDTLDMQKQIVLDYEEDARKYANGLDQAKIISVLRSIPSQLAKENTRFQYNKISKHARSREYTGCIDWLVDSGIVNRCCCMNFPELPIKGNIDISKFKLYFADTGLLISMLDDETQQDLRSNKNLGVYKGALYENFAAEALYKQGYELCYYKRQNSTLEEDFFIRDTNSLIPVEVKSERENSPSLSTLIKNDHYPDIKSGIRFANSNVGLANNIQTFPYFCCFMLKEYQKNLVRNKIS